MVESKYVLYSLLAGVIAGALSSIMMLFKLNAIEEFVREFMYQQLLLSGLSEEGASEVVKMAIDGVRAFLWLAPIGPIINMLFLGALLGVLLDFLVKKLRRPYYPSILTGLVLIALQVVPIMVINWMYGSWFTELLDRYIGLPFIIAVPIVYTILLTIFSSIKGPWTKWGEAKPKIY
ncbi:MAG: hypothetical protein QXD66_07275 [Candidatus Nezhaarchaeales archaeon]|nr:MAG: hypothetical protein DSO06_05470 [Candidatus Nezhaarchaeota archaeon WYZ-LMO8]